jgi:hypothetical protein
MENGTAMALYTNRMTRNECMHPVRCRGCGWVSGHSAENRRQTRNRRRRGFSAPDGVRLRLAAESRRHPFRQPRTPCIWRADPCLCPPPCR